MRANVQVSSYKTWQILAKIIQTWQISVNKFSTECPAEQPEFGSACSLPEGAQCPYGEECCCGECHPKWGKTHKEHVSFIKYFYPLLQYGQCHPKWGKTHRRTILIQNVCSLFIHALQCGECHPKWAAHVSSTLSECGSIFSEGSKTENLLRNLKVYKYHIMCNTTSKHPMLSKMMECGGGSWTGYHTEACMLPNCGNTTGASMLIIKTFFPQFSLEKNHCQDALRCVQQFLTLFAVLMETPTAISANSKL